MHDFASIRDAVTHLTCTKQKERYPEECVHATWAHDSPGLVEEMLHKGAGGRGEGEREAKVVEHWRARPPPAAAADTPGPKCQKLQD